MSITHMEGVRFLFQPELLVSFPVDDVSNHIMLSISALSGEVKP